MTRGRLPGLLGFRVVEISGRGVVAELDVRPDLLAPNGYLHAATVVALADTACGIGCRLTLPEGAKGFTTTQVTTNYVGTARGGSIRTVASLAHDGRRTQVWDAGVADGGGRKIAMFRCTQLILWP
ncbi:PaaI family thioesterase [Spirillospora sp. NPDC049024]